MNRIFHARIAGYQYGIILLLGSCAVFALWDKRALLALIWMLLLIVVIERIIHSTYTITSDNKLIVYSGRFIKKRIIPIDEIKSVTLRNSIKMGGFSLLHYVLIEHGKNKYTSVIPMKEKEFLALLEKRRDECANESM